MTPCSCVAGGQGSGPGPHRAAVTGQREALRALLGMMTPEVRHARRASGKVGGTWPLRARPAPPLWPRGGRCACAARQAEAGTKWRTAGRRARRRGGRSSPQEVNTQRLASRTPGGEGGSAAAMGGGGAGGATPGRAMRGQGPGPATRPPQGWPRPLRSGCARSVLLERGNAAVGWLAERNALPRSALCADLTLATGKEKKNASKFAFNSCGTFASRDTVNIPCVPF